MVSRIYAKGIIINNEIFSFFNIFILFYLPFAWIFYLRKMLGVPDDMSRQWVPILSFFFFFLLNNVEEIQNVIAMDD